MLLFLLIIISPSCSAGLFEVDQENDNPYTIEAKSHEYYLRKHTNKVTNKCSVNEMVSYGLEADSPNLSYPNELCPRLKNGNCCGQEDIKRIKKYWEYDTRHQGYYHASFLKMNKYLLGFARQYRYIADNIITRSRKWIIDNRIPDTTKPIEIDDDFTDIGYKISYHPMCLESAQKFIKMDYVNREKAKHFYELLNKRAEYLQNARRGFYCMLCDAKSRNYIKTRKFSSSKQSLKFSRDFCELTYNWVYKSVYLIHRSYNTFIMHLFRMLSCVKPLNNETDKKEEEKEKENKNYGDILLLSDVVKIDSKVPYSNLSEDMQKLYTNPLKLKKRFWLEACYNADPDSFWFPIKCYRFCDSFKLVKADPLFDGDIDAMDLIYHQLLPYEFALASPNDNFFDENVPQLKTHIEIALKHLGRNYLFYRALNPETDFENYFSDFSIFYKGVNPMALSAGTPLEFVYKFLSNMWVGFILLLIIEFK